MGRKSAKGKEKKLKKKEESSKLAVKLAVVEAANAQQDPMQTLLPFKKYDRNGLNLSISCHRAKDLDEGILDWAFELTKSNMQSLYEMSEWGWNEKDKREEMTDDRAWYLIARDISDESSRPIALVHFRFDLDNGDEVLYCYEIQLCPEVRRKGLGKFMMQILELMAFKSQMKKVMVTVFKNNTESQEFFVNKLKYGIDETSPEDSVEDAIFYPAESTSYEILSKPIGVRQQQAAPAKNGAAGIYGMSAQPMMMPTCCDHCEHHH